MLFNLLFASVSVANDPTVDATNFRARKEIFDRTFQFGAMVYFSFITLEDK